MDMLEAEMSITGGRLTSYSDFLRQAWSRFPANLKKNFGTRKPVNGAERNTN
jgi:hypothetical protein